MTVTRVVGTEVEYGISVQGQPGANPMLAATQIVNAYASAAGLTRRARWDFEEESPLRDARGFDLGRDHADPGLLTDEDLGLANVILANGARLYVDHAHPEYSAPETTNPRDAVLWEVAGEHVMRRAAELAGRVPGVPPILLYKNNVDNKGASYGAHENYLMRRDVPFAAIVEHLTPFFVSRQVVTGAGRVGRQQDGSEQGFQISQRADYFEVGVGLETTLKRPIINTRDEPHADPQKYRRLHVIIGDASCSEISSYLKVGTTSLVLAMIEADAIPSGLAVARPVRSVHEVSHDHTLAHEIELADGRRMSAVELQREYLSLAQKFVQQGSYDTDDTHADQTQDVLRRWEDVLDALESDPMSLADQLDWVAKLALLEQYRERDGLGWDHAKLHLVDLQYHDVRLGKGLYHRLVDAGRMQRLLTDAEVAAAVGAPPEDTRAYFRGTCLRRFPDQVAAASWDSVIFDLPGHDSLQRVPTLEPLRGTREHVGDLFDRSSTAAELFQAITGR
ncbi:MAG: depupylase/deamidase Dop [Nocardioidaceae bacterium]|nr:depupylase/deamidase Dop [Nocardioidaceae bacterium]